MPLRLGRGPLGREDLWRLSVIPEARREPARENRVIMTRTGMEQAGLHQGPHLTLHVLPFIQTHTPRESLRMAWVRRKIKIPELLPITGYSENRQAVSSGHFWLAKGQLLSSQKG